MVHMQTKLGEPVLLRNVLLLLQQENEYVCVHDHFCAEPQVPDALALLILIHLGELEFY